LLAYLGGLISGHKSLFPGSHIIEFAQHVRSAALMDESGAGDQVSAVEDTEERIIWSIFLPLHLKEVSVPPGRRGAGGGLTSVGDDALLLTHDGRIFIISGETVSLSSITPPDNGFQAYAEAAAGPLSHLEHYLAAFRYNDILFYSAGGEAGLVVSYTEWLDGRECYCTTLSHLKLDADFGSISQLTVSPRDWEIIYRTQPCLPPKSIMRAIEGHMAGGRIAFLPPETVVLGSGDYHWDGIYAPEALAQNPDKDYGKIIAINLAGKGARQLSIGNRNVQGVQVDQEGQIWTVEHGPRGGDELNKIIPGRNYGWPLATLGTQYNKLPIASAKSYGRHDGYEAPIYAWLPSAAVSNLTQIQGFDPAWDGDLLVASLKGETLFRIRIKQDRVVFAEPIKVGQRIRYAHQHTDGRIILWTDAGKLIFVTLSDVTAEGEFVDNIIDEMDLSDSRKKALRTALDGCRECHAFSRNDDFAAPNLGDVFNRPIASTAFPGYSQALRSRSGLWTSDSLKNYLMDPDEFAPGTTMPGINIKAETTSDVVYVLEQLQSPE